MSQRDFVEPEKDQYEPRSEYTERVHRARIDHYFQELSGNIDRYPDDEPGFQGDVLRALKAIQAILILEEMR